MELVLKTIIKRGNLLGLAYFALLLIIAGSVWGFGNERVMLIVMVVGAVGFFQVLVHLHEKKEAKEHPEYVRKLNMEDRDERNILIRDRSAFQAITISVEILYMLAIPFLLFLDNLTLFWSFFGIATAQRLIFYPLKRYNNKKF